MSNNNRGWGFPATGRKAHYFHHEAVSLCGKWAFLGELDDSQDDHKQNCAECRKRKKRLDANLNALKSDEQPAENSELDDPDVLIDEPVNSRPLTTYTLDSSDHDRIEKALEAEYQRVSEGAVRTMGHMPLTFDEWLEEALNFESHRESARITQKHWEEKLAGIQAENKTLFDRAQQHDTAVYAICRAMNIPVYWSGAFGLPHGTDVLLAEILKAVQSREEKLEMARNLVKTADQLRDEARDERDALKAQLALFASADAYGFVIKLDDAEKHVARARELVGLPTPNGK